MHILVRTSLLDFLSETHEQFLDTRKVMEEVKFDSAFIFKYSEREGTLAKRKFPDDVPEKAKTERIVELNELQKIHTSESLAKFIGQKNTVLVEKESTPLSRNNVRAELTKV